jgi:O-antigen/teichoic acid export membrane protein
MVMMLSARWLFPRMFNPDYIRSADIFVVYILLSIPRLVFPQTIIVGRKKTHITLFAAVIELAINIPLSLFLVTRYGTVGVAVATFIVFSLEKIFLIGYVWKKMKIKPSEYIPVVPYLIYSTLLSILFVLIDRRIIDIH